MARQINLLNSNFEQITALFTTDLLHLNNAFLNALAEELNKIDSNLSYSIINDEDYQSFNAWTSEGSMKLRIYRDGKVDCGFTGMNRLDSNLVDTFLTFASKLQ